MANTLKKHYDGLSERINSIEETINEWRLQDCIRRYAITNHSLRQFAFKWGLKQVGLMKQFQGMSGPSDPSHNTNSSKYQEMEKLMNNKNFFQEGARQQKIDLPFDPYYAEIWGNVSGVSPLVHPF